MDILFTIYHIVLYFTLLYAAFFTITGIIGVILRSRVKIKETNKNNYFAILIAARNEEKVIVNLINSLKRQNYPKDKYEIITIPNNCTDNTEKVAKENGSKIINCTVPTKTKGEVLKFVFNKLKNNKKIDAYVIFDADNVVHPDFLKNMNKHLESGYRVMQGFRATKNAGDNWISGSYNVYYMMQSLFIYRSRMGLNTSATINGTGFVVKKDYIDQYGFDTKTLTEDIEFSGLCSLNNERIIYVKDAITYDEHPTKFSTSWKQRKRWSSGTIHCSRLYSFKLLKNFFKKGNFASLDVCLLYCGPMIQLVSALLMLIVFFGRIILYKMNMEDILLSLVYTSLTSYITTVIIALLSILFTKQKIKPTLSGIIFFPIFLITWIPINIICLFKKTTTWEIINHDRSITIDEKLN